jgi:glutamine synthetase
MLCDIFFPDGRPMPLDTRHVYKRALKTLADRGYDFIAGLEVEFHLFKLEQSKLGIGDAGQPGQPGEPPDVSLLNQGYQYLTEQRYDEMNPILEILRTNIVDLGLPLRSIEVEFGPSQVEFTFRAGTGLEPAEPWCSSGAPPSRSPSATAITSPSCAGRGSPTSCRAAGTCISR